MVAKETMIYMNWRKLIIFSASIFFLFLYNEILVYYGVLLQCAWPSLDSDKADFTIHPGSSDPLKIMILADTHLLGSREGHWFDKLRREWQMERSFQAAMMIHNPEVVFILGDLFDEGKWCSDSEFYYYVQHFNQMFRHSEDTKLYVLAGNHDIGFHYMIDENKRRRFSSAFSASSVRKLNIQDNIFILVNSMALEGDDCNMCRAAENRLKKISQSLQCAQGLTDKSSCTTKEDNYKYTKPILLQHFPMYRKSDVNCSGPDTVPPSEKNILWKPKWDTLSKSSSQKLFEWIEPRLIFSGHTHHFCQHTHSDGTPEWTVPSFSWRNKPNPSFLLVKVSNNNYSINKCYLPQESTVIYTYITGGVLIIFWFLLPKTLYTSPVSRSISNKTL